MGRSLKAQMRQANRLGAKTVLIIGDDEAKAGTVQLRDMESGDERTVGVDEAVHVLQEKRGGSDDGGVERMAADRIDAESCGWSTKDRT